MIYCGRKVSAEVFSIIYEKISNYFSPLVPFATVDQMRKTRLPAERIFDGLQLEHGFADSEVMRRAKRRTFIYASDLIHAIMKVDGVRTVKDINMTIGEKMNAWSLKIPDNSVPVLDLDQSSITLEKDQLGASVDLEKARKNYVDRLK